MTRDAVLSVVSSGHSEQDTARDLHRQIRERLVEIAGFMDAANRIDMRVEFSLGIDGYGRNVIQRLAVLKEIVS